jgi:hypothetical protein
MEDPGFIMDMPGYYKANLVQQVQLEQLGLLVLQAHLDLQVHPD